MAFPTTGIIDDFNRANDSSLGANWTVYVTAFSGTRNGQIISNAASGDGSSQSQLWWNPSTFGVDQEAYMTVATLPGTNNNAGLFLRLTTIASGTTDGYYFLYTQVSGTDTWVIRRLDDGAITDLASTTTDLVAGNKIGASAIGSTLTFWRHDGSSWASIVSTTDATYAPASSNIGITMLQTTVRLDDFGGGTVVGGFTSQAGSVTPSGLLPKKISQPLGNA